ncbi:MAG: sulfur relay protein DsrC [bacterium]
MLNVSDILMYEHELDSFQGLLEIVRQKAQDGEMFIQMDIKPNFPDTPENWEAAIENAFTSS